MDEYRGNVARFSGFAADYDRYRFAPPEVLAEILCRYAAVERPALVVDLGCGTGLSTRYWAERAEKVVGVDPASDMIERARAGTGAENVAYRLGYGHETGMPSDGADVVTCSQSFHWMEPESTLAEVARILRPGGVFAAYHYDMPVATGIAELDRQAIRTENRIYELEAERELKKETRFYGKEGHLESLERSGRFRLVREIFLHKVDWTSADRLVRGFETLGALQTLRKLGVTDDEMELPALRDAAARHLGEARAPLYVSYFVRLGVLPESV